MKFRSLTLAWIVPTGGLAVAALLSFSTPAIAQSACDPSPTPYCIGANDRLKANQELRSKNGAFRAIMQSDCNFVIYAAPAYAGAPASRAIWQSHTLNKGSGCWATLQHDGNFVVYDGNNRALFSTATHGKGSGVRLVMQDDGNLVLKNVASNTPLWNSGSDVPVAISRTVTKFGEPKTVHTIDWQPAGEVEVLSNKDGTGTASYSKQKTTTESVTTTLENTTTVGLDVAFEATAGLPGTFSQKTAVTASLQNAFKVGKATENSVSNTETITLTVGPGEEIRWGKWASTKVVRLPWEGITYYTYGENRETSFEVPENGVLTIEVRETRQGTRPG